MACKIFSKSEGDYCLYSVQGIIPLTRVQAKLLLEATLFIPLKGIASRDFRGLQMI